MILRLPSTLKLLWIKPTRSQRSKELRLSSIAYLHKINLFVNHPTRTPEVCMVRTTYARSLVYQLNDSKNFFFGFNWWILPSYMGIKIKAIVTLLLRLWISFHLMLCIAIVMLFAYNWSNIRFESNSSYFKITFEIRKNAQF